MSFTAVSDGGVNRFAAMVQKYGAGNQIVGEGVTDLRCNQIWS